MFDIKEIIINRFANIYPGETPDDLLRIAIDFLNSFEFPKKVTLLITAKPKVQYDLQRCVTFQLSLLFILLR